MKIVIDARLYGLHHRGIGRYLIELINGLIKDESPYTYILLVDPKAIDKLPSLPPNITTVAAPYRVYSIAEQLFLPRLIKKISPDLVHWTHFSAPYFCSAPYVITIHDLILHHAPNERASRLPGLIYWLKILAYRKLLARLIHRAKNIITVSQSVADDIIKYYPLASAKINVIHLAPPLLPPAEYLPINNPFLLMVGAAYPHKNIERVIQAVALVRQHYPNLELRLVGRLDFFSNKLKAWVESNGWADWIIFMDKISDAQLVGLYKKCEAYCLLSLQEGFGLGLVEAAVAGAPIVASDIAVFHEVIGAGACYADPKNISSIAEVIRNILNPKVKHEVIARALKEISKFSWPKTIADTLLVYRRTIE